MRGQRTKSGLKEDALSCSVIKEGKSEMTETDDTILLDIPFHNCQTIEKESWALFILSVRLEDYWKFVSDEGGELRSDLFDSDGWDFLSANQVNEEIERTLADPADLWAQYNGVTLIASIATIQGKSMQLRDVQIIDGLQTTQIICRHFQGAATAKDKNLLVKIVVIPDAQGRNEIIKATSYKGQPVTDSMLLFPCLHEPHGM